MGYVFNPPATVGVPVHGGGDLFPVRRIFCVGRNYAAHAREMGHDPDREPPFFFTKPAEAIVICADPKSPARVAYPSATKNLHHEMELVVALKSGGTDIAVDKALSHVFGYGCGLDMTRRDLQNQAKDMGRPWDMGKGFDQSAPIGELYQAAKIGHPAKGTIQLDVNGKTRQKSDLNALIWSVPEDDLLSFRPGRPGARRPDLQRHARRRGGGGQGRHAGRLRRRLRHGDLRSGLKVILSEAKDLDRCVLGATVRVDRSVRVLLCSRQQDSPTNMESCPAS